MDAVDISSLSRSVVLATFAITFLLGAVMQKTGFGNGDMIYTRSDRKVTDLNKLKSMVARCNTELRLDLFPEDEADVAAFLNKQFYKFK